MIFHQKYFPPRFGLFLILLLFCSCQKQDKPNREEPRESLRVASVERKRLRSSLKASGSLALAQEVSVAFKIGGTVGQMYAEKGDQVVRGQLLALINQSELQERYRQAQENYRQLNSTRQRTEKLYEEENIGTLQNLDELRSREEVAQSSLNIASRSLQDVRLTAPNSGIVIEKFLEEGEIASPGRPVYLLSGRGEAYVFKAALTDIQVVKIKIGDSSTLHLSAYPGQPLSGKVTNIATTPNPQTELYEVEISFSPSKLDLKPGFLGYALIFTKQNQKYAFIPPQALIEAQGYEATVYVPTSSKSYEARKVKIAHIGAEEIAIAEGLEGVEKVVLP